MKKICILTVMCFLLNACTDKLELSPLDSISTLNFFKTQEDFDLAVNGLYNYMQGKGNVGRNGVYAGDLYWEVASDAAYFQFSWHTPWYDISNGNLAPTTDNVRFIWDTGYRAIGWANTILDNMDKASIDANTKKIYEGEVKFLRAITYLRMVSLYGDVPLILKKLPVSEAKVPRDSKESVLTQVVADLDEAAQKLSLTPLNGQKGRATKQAALGMKVRALTYAASPLFNPSGDTKKWEAAKTAASELMTIATQNPTLVGLESSYDNIFSVSNEDNKEVLFNIEYTANNSQEGGNNLLPFGPRTLPTQGGVAGGWGSSAITPEYADSYLMKDGLPAASSPLYSAANPWANRDPRFYTTYFVAGISTLPDGSIFNIDRVNSFPGGTFQAAYPMSIRKGVDPSAKNQAYDNEQAPNTIILRYADVLLMYAEAQNEVSGPDATVYAAINQIRSRAGLPNLATGLSKDAMRTAIQNERKWELGYEGVRYFDIRRWKIADTVLNNLPKGPTLNVTPAKKFVATKHYWWPLAQSTIDANPKLIQNDGY